MSGSNLGAQEHYETSLSLLKAIESRVGWALALDSKGRIRHQYEQKVRRVRRSLAAPPGVNESHSFHQVQET